MPLITCTPIRRDMPIDSFKHVLDDGVQRRPQWRVECPSFVHNTMKPKLRAILYRAIEEGVRQGAIQAHKHSDTPSTEWLASCIEDAVWLAIDEVFDFEP